MAQVFARTLGVLFVVVLGSRGENISKEFDTCTEFGNRLRDLEKGMREQKMEIDKQKDTIDTQNEVIRKLKFKVDTLQSEQKIVIDKLREKAVTNHSNHRNNIGSRFQRYLLNALDTPIGFTAYLDHTAQHLGVDQTIIFNNALFNDGAAYNSHSGIFTCPENGVYLFFFEVGSGLQNQVVAKLVANSVNQVDAIADSEYHRTHEAQGSNRLF